MEIQIFKVEGMSCGGCERSVENAIRQLAGVRAVKAEHASGKVMVEVANDPVTMEAVRGVVEAIGFRLIG